MKTRKTKLLVSGMLIMIVVLIAATGLITAAMAAPSASVEGKVQAALMDPLPEASCTLNGSVRTCEIWALTGSLAIPGGALVPAWGFADNAAGPAQVPGPVIRAAVGETLEIVLHNEILGEDVSLAFPGLDVIPDFVGVPAGGTTTYTLPLTQPGTLLFEAGLTAGGARQVAMGLFGALVIEPSTVAHDQEITLVFSEMDTGFNADPLNYGMNHFDPNFWLINGQAYPDTGIIEVAPGSTLLVRYLNAGSEHLSIGLLGVDQQVLAKDGVPLPFPRGAVTEPLAPGETKDALILVPNAAPGTLYALYNTSLHQHNNNERIADGRTAFGGMLVFLQITGEVIPGTSGPIASNVTIDPAKTNGSTDITLSATLTDEDNVVAYEYHLDVLGEAGTGNLVTIATPAASVDVVQIFTSAVISAWESGEHTLYILGQDSLGNWGPPGSAVVYLDKLGPAITGISLNPNPVNGDLDVLLSATADDRANGNSTVVAANYTFNGITLALILSPAGTSVKEVSATILATEVASLNEGVYPVTINAQDEWGNWSALPGAIDLVVDKTGPAVSGVTLNPITLDFNQALPVTSVRLEATVADAISLLANAEAFIDVVGAPGEGFDLYPADGLFDEAIENVYFNMPVNHFSTLTEGEHTIYVTGLDKAGNWTPAGSEGSAVISIIAAVADVTRPVVTDLAISAAGGNQINLTGLATDTQSNITSAIWYLVSDPNTTYPMSAADGAFDSLSESLIANIRINQWAKGTHEIVVIARDAAGNWSQAVTIIYTK